MFAKVIAAVILTTVAVNTAREVVEESQAANGKGYFRFGCKCATLSILASAAVAATVSVFDKE